MELFTLFVIEIPRGSSCHFHRIKVVYTQLGNSESLYFCGLVIPCNLSFITGPLSLFSRVIISTLTIPSKTGLVLLRKDWRKWRKVTCLLQSYTWRLQFSKSPTMPRYSLLCLFLAEEKGTPSSMEWWNDFWAQTSASHDWVKHWILRVMN